MRKDEFGEKILAVLRKLDLNEPETSVSNLNIYHWKESS